MRHGILQSLDNVVFLAPSLAQHMYDPHPLVCKQRLRLRSGPAAAIFLQLVRISSLVLLHSCGTLAAELPLPICICLLHDHEITPRALAFMPNFWPEKTKKHRWGCETLLARRETRGHTP